MPTAFQYLTTPSDALTTGVAPQVMEELEGSPRESVRNEAVMVVREFKAPFDARLDGWARGMLVQSAFVNGSCRITRPMEYSHSARDGQGNALGRIRVAQVDFRPFGDRVQAGAAAAPSIETWAAYAWARATVTYRCLEAIAEELQVGAEFTTMGAGGLYWNTEGGGPSAVGEREAPGMLVHQALWSVTRRWLPVVPVEYLSLVGMVNPQSIASARYGVTFAAGTLLYQAPAIRSYTDRFGNVLHDVTARLLYRPAGWNRFWLARVRGWLGLLRADPQNQGQYLDASPYATAPGDGSFGVLCQYAAADV